MSTMKELVGTDNKKEQVEYVQQLIKRVNSPVIDLIIRFENEQVDISMMGGDVSFDILYKMLDMTRQALHQRELEMAVQQAASVTDLEEKAEEVEE